MRFRLPLLLATLLLLWTQGGASAAPGSPVPPVPAGWPQKLVIPKIQVSASVEHLNFLDEANVHAPFRWEDVAWHSKGPRPGQPGHAAIFGHLDSTCCPAVFWHLGQLQPGDEVDVVYRDNKTERFRVMWLHDYLNTALPTDWLFAGKGQRGLVLMTCAGDFHQDGVGYDHKLAVYARLILPNGKLG